MGVYSEVDVRVKGQVNLEDNTYDVVIAEINLICKKYGLELEEY